MVDAQYTELILLLFSDWLGEVMLGKLKSWIFHLPLNVVLFLLKLNQRKKMKIFWSIYNLI